MKTLPKTIYVKLERPENDEPFLVASDEKYGLVEAGERLKIGTYKLVEVEDAEMQLSLKKAR